MLKVNKHLRRFTQNGRVEKTNQNANPFHGPSQSGPYSRVRDLLATFTLNLSLRVLLLRVEGRREQIAWPLWDRLWLEAGESFSFFQILGCHVVPLFLVADLR